MTFPIGLMILAAGGSARLGNPKQLLHYQGRTLLRHAAETALASQCRPIVVVLGAQAGRLRSELTGLDVRITENSEWKQGMGSSIRAGLAALEAVSTELDGVLVMLCDQPLVTADFLDRFHQSYQDTHSALIASEYDGTHGVPAFFSRALFPELHSLSGAQGAKPILLHHASEITALPFPSGTIDIDTESDYQRLVENEDLE